MSDDKSNETPPLFAMVARFWIDDGELDGLAPEAAFVLGAEFALVLARLEEEPRGRTNMHLKNKDRLIKAARDKGRHARALDLKDGEPWATLDWWTGEEAA